MGILEVNQIKTKLEQRYLDLIEVVTNGKTMNEQQHRNFLSKALAVYSISTLYADVDDQEIVKCLVDGGEDNGIDLIYYHPVKKELCIVQSKFNAKGDSEPDLGEVKKFRDGIRDLICLKFDKFNQRVNERSREICSILEESDLKFRLVLVYTATTLSSHARKEMNELLSEINDRREIATFEIVNQQRLHSSLYMSNGVSINTDISLHEWAKYEGERIAYYGQITGDQLCELWESYGDSLFDSNIRKALGSTDINMEIQETLNTEPELFWYYNNGITIICDDILKKPMFGTQRHIGIFDCKGISIVNGAQTVGVIGKYGQASEENKIKLSEVSINIKIISISNTDDEGNLYKDEIFSNRVTTKTNRQNSIGSRDFLSLDPHQRKMERDLLIEGIKYNLMRSEDDDQRDESSFGVKEATRALAFAKDIDSTITVRREISSIFEDLDNAKYKKLYNPSVTSFYVWNCVRIQRIIEDHVKLISETANNQEKAVLIYAKEIISRILFDRIGNEEIPKDNLNIEGVFNGIDLQNDLLTIIEKIRFKVEDSSKNISNIFKSPSDMRNIYEFAKLTAGDRSETDENEGITLSLELSSINDPILQSQIQNFYDKMSSDIPATMFLNYWLSEIFDSNRYKMVYRSNFNIFEINNETGEENFIVRIAYHTKLIVSFEFYGDKYQSELYKNDEFIQWLQQSLNGGTRMSIESERDVEILKGLKYFL
ncbi:AIPR family protein [Bacillus sp. RIT694]|uniref:AIPR family protein n=1 Tax=Bacillus sp. RIT694 TaxID=2666190 RepID=UPI00189D4EB4|nr:AIPR family protein [Bacillus sp. RIT694]